MRSSYQARLSGLIAGAHAAGPLQRGRRARSAVDAAPVCSDRFALRTVIPSDWPTLYRWEADPTARAFLGYRDAAPSLRTFKQRMDMDLSRHLMISTHSGVPVAWITLYNHNPADGWVWLTILADPARQRSGDGMECAALAITSTFLSMPIRKIYADTYEQAFYQFARGSGRYFEVEGHLKDHTYIDGRYADKYVLAIERSRFLERSARYRQHWQFTGDRPLEGR